LYVGLTEGEPQLFECMLRDETPYILHKLVIKLENRRSLVVPFVIGWEMIIL